MDFSDLLTLDSSFDSMLNNDTPGQDISGSVDRLLALTFTSEVTMICLVIILFRYDFLINGFFLFCCLLRILLVP